MIRCPKAPWGEWVEESEEQRKTEKRLCSLFLGHNCEAGGCGPIAQISGLFLPTDTFCCHIKYYPEASVNSRKKARLLWSGRGGENK